MAHLLVRGASEFDGAAVNPRAAEPLGQLPGLRFLRDDAQPDRQPRPGVESGQAVIGDQMAVAQDGDAVGSRLQLG